MNRPAWPGLLLAILACLGIVAAVAVARWQEDETRKSKALKRWAELEAWNRRRTR